MEPESHVILMVLSPIKYLKHSVMSQCSTALIVLAQCTDVTRLNCTHCSCSIAFIVLTLVKSQHWTKTMSAVKPCDITALGKKNECN